VIREAEAQQRVELSKFEQERAVLEHTILELRTFEREYRIKLKTYIEGQLAELEFESKQNNSGNQSANSSPSFQIGSGSANSSSDFFGV
jgi:hypothetical protein